MIRRDDIESPIETAPARRPIVLYLDQNKWIDLARAAHAPEEHREDYAAFERLCLAVEAGQVTIPLTTSNFYETQKVNNFELRAAIARTQVALSGGRVFRGRRRRLEIEGARVLADLYEKPWTEPDPDWVLSSIFFEAVAEAGTPALGLSFSQWDLERMAEEPQAALFDYLLARDEAIRQHGLMMFEAGVEQLRANVESRRARHRDQSASMKRKIQSALIFLDDQEALIQAADALNLDWRCFMDNNGTTARRMLSETPTLVAQREMTLKLEGQKRAIHVNDFCDMQNFTTVLPYADVIIAEKQFVNLARQAGMDSRFKARLGTRLSSLGEFLDQS